MNGNEKKSLQLVVLALEFFFFYKRGNKCLLYCFKMASLSMIKHHLHEIFLECLYIKLITKLLTRYIAFFWPVFEYSDVVWENCSENDAKHLKYNQVETARMITGLRCNVSCTKLLSSSSHSYCKYQWDIIQFLQVRSTSYMIYQTTLEELLIYPLLNVY